MVISSKATRNCPRDLSSLLIDTGQKPREISPKSTQHTLFENPIIACGMLLERHQQLIRVSLERRLGVTRECHMHWLKVIQKIRDWYC